MSLPAWTFTFDHQQRRFSRLRIGIIAAGSDLVASVGNAVDTGLSQNVWVDPVTHTTFLMPRCLEDAWLTSNSGAYAKWGLTDVGSPSGLVEADQQGNGFRPFLHGVKNITMQTTSALAVNTGVVLEFMNYSNGANGIALECGWDAGTTVEAGTAFQFYTNGDVFAYRNGATPIKKGSISGPNAPSTTQNQSIQILLIPHRRRELLVVNPAGAGFVVRFDDIDEDDTAPEITPAAKFWFRQTDVSTDVLAAPLRWNTSGIALSELYKMGEAPDGTDVSESFDNASWAGGTGQDYRIYGDESYRTGNTDAAVCSLVTTSGSAFSPDGTTRDCRLKIALSGDGDSSPAIYGAEMAFAGREALTDDSEEYDATDAVGSFSLNVPDGGGSTASLEIIAGSAVDTAVANLRTMARRPFLIANGTTHILNGRLSHPKYRRMLNEVSERVVFTANTTIDALKNYRFREKKPLDGMLVSHSTDDCLVRFLLHQVGVQDASMDLEDSTVRIGDIAPEVCGDWNESIEVGASGWEVLERFMEDYLGGWFYDVVPTASGIVFKVASPATILGASSVVDLYWTGADAIAGGVDPADVWKYVVREMDVETVECESNEVVVTGFNPRTGKAIQAVKRDYASQDPTTAPSSRPSNWLGEPAIVGYINKGLTTQVLVESAVDVIASKLFNERELVEIESQYVLVNPTTGVPLWRGDKVTVDGSDYIVQTLAMSAVSIADGFEWNPTKYTLSNLIGQTGGMTANDIAARERRNRQEKAIQRRNSQGLTLLAIESVSVVP